MSGAVQTRQYDERGVLLRGVWKEQGGFQNLKE
jgi:hypothetical protein